MLRLIDDCYEKQFLAVFIHKEVFILNISSKYESIRLKQICVLYYLRFGHVRPSLGFLR